MVMRSLKANCLSFPRLETLKLGRTMGTLHRHRFISFGGKIVAGDIIVAQL